MPLMKKTQRSFAGGMLDKDLMGRQDLAKYSQGCLTLENFKVRKQGNVIKRSGTDLVCDFTRIRWSFTPYTESIFVATTKTPIAAAKLVPIVQERESGLYMLITGGRAYLVSPEGVKMDDGSWSRWPYKDLSDVQTSFPPPEGEEPEVDPGWLTIYDLESLANPYSIEVPFADSDLKMLDWCQSGDTIFFAHRSYPPCKILYAGGELEYERIQFRRGSGSPPRIAELVKNGTWNGTANAATVEYAVTAVKDGVESEMSVPVATQYNLPWGTGNSITVVIDTSGLEPDSWDCFYIYKKESDVFGLIGTTSNQTAFVDISSGFTVNGSMYPSGYTQFDKTVHLRESGNKFARVHEISEFTVTNTKSSVALGSMPTQPYTTMDNIQALLWFNNHNQETEETSDPVKTKSGSAQKSAAENVSFTLGTAGQELSEFSVRIGSLEHKVEKSTEVQVTETWATTATFAGWSGTYGLHPEQRTTKILDPKWTGVKSIFTACPAKFFTATVEYLNGSTWTTSSPIDCKAIVDQSSPGTGWTSAGGGKFERTYGDSDAMWSYTDAASVLVRMDAYAPPVGAEAQFELPSAIVGKKIRNVTVYGWTDDSKTTAAGLIVNGLACYKAGKYVDSFTDSYITPDLTITPPKAEDHFVNPGEYPGCVQIYSQRLVYAASAKEPFKFWMSSTGDLYNFDVHEYLRASDAISASTAALEMPRINRMLVHRDLMLFAEGGEWQVAPSTGNAVAPTTLAAKLQSTIGCAAWLKPIPIDADILFCDSSGETLMATRYNFASDGYESSNLSVLSQRLFRNNPIEAMAYVQFPESTVECVLKDGTIASLVYMKEHDVCAWSHHTLGGEWKAKDVAANKSMVAGSSHCAFVAERTYDVYESPDSDVHETFREWAIFALRDIDPNDTSLVGNLRLDGVHTVTLEIADGTTPPFYPQPERGHGEIAVKIGTITTTTPSPRTTDVVWALGCPFKSVMKTTSPEFTDKETAQMEVKNATESEVRVIDGSNFTVRQPEVPENKATQMKVETLVFSRGFGGNYEVTLSDADCRMPLVGTNTRNGSIVLEHDGYLPLAVLSVSTSYRVEFANHANGGSGDE